MATERAAQMASDWGSRLIALGEVGHLNSAAEYGPWPRAIELLEKLFHAN